MSIALIHRRCPFPLHAARACSANSKGDDACQRRSQLGLTSSPQSSGPSIYTDCGAADCRPALAGSPGASDGFSLSCNGVPLQQRGPNTTQSFPDKVSTALRKRKCIKNRARDWGLG